MKDTVNPRKVSKKSEGPNFGVGSIGKVKILMMQELDTLPSKTRPSNTAPVSIYCSDLRKRTESNKTSANNYGNSTISRRAASARKKVSQIPSPHCIPMLESEDIAVDKTPTSVGQEGRRTRFVDVVDLKCGNGSQKRLSSPIANQIRRLSFSKLSG